MAFHDLEEFPEKTIEGNIGVNVATSSNLAYEKERLSYTSMSTAFLPDGKYYHREAATAAHLSYVAIPELDRYDTYGKDSTTGKTVGNQPKDWIVYTNAKVYPTVIDENTLAAANAASP